VNAPKAMMLMALVGQIAHKLKAAHIGHVDVGEQQINGVVGREIGGSGESADQLQIRRIAGISFTRKNNRVNMQGNDMM